MKGLEGQVVKVDRRKKRAKIKLELYDDSFLVDFGFEFLQKMKENDAQE
jgi:transcriptional antiterminator NusG